MKIRLLSETEQRMFRRIHTAEDVLAVEEGKIRREKGLYVSLRRQAKTRLKERLKKIRGIIGEEVWAEEEMDQVEHRAARLYRNARRHKRRLYGLRYCEEE